MLFLTLTKPLRPSGILVSFSPTIDQVVKTTEALKENNFVFIETIECMMRAMQIERGKTRPQTLMTGHTGYITHARKILRIPQQPTPEPAEIEQANLAPEAEELQENDNQENVEMAEETA